MNKQIFPYTRTGNEVIGLSKQGLAEIKRRMPDATEEEVVATVHEFGWLMPDEFTKYLSKPWNERTKLSIIPDQGEVL